MQKTNANIIRDRVSKNGMVWVKRPSYNYRQSSGVEFRGMYMTRQEYQIYIATGYFPVRIDPKEVKRCTEKN